MRTNLYVITSDKPVSIYTCNLNPYAAQSPALLCIGNIKWFLSTRDRISKKKIKSQQTHPEDLYLTNHGKYSEYFDVQTLLPEAFTAAVRAQSSEMVRLYVIQDYSNRGALACYCAVPTRFSWAGPIAANWANGFPNDGACPLSRPAVSRAQGRTV